MKSTYIKSTYVNQPITVENKVASIDSSYGPYKTIQEALNSIPYKYRALGRTVAIIEDNEVKEYQWKSGIGDSDLVEKYSGAEPTEPITWNTLGGKPTIIASGETPAEARTAIGAGISNLEIGTTSTTAMAGDTPLLTIGTTASTAKAGNYTPSATEVVTALNAMTPEQIEEIQLLLGVTP